MNLKKAKKLRQFLRSRGIAVSDVVLQPKKPVFIPGNVLLGQPGAMFLGAHKLASTCGRAKYQQMKKLAARAV